MKSPKKPALGPGDAFFQSIIDAALDAVITMDADGRVMHWSAQAERTFGWSAEDAVGRSLSTLIIPRRDRAAHERGLRRFLVTGTSRILQRRVELAGRTRDGREIPVELTVVPFQWEGNPAFIGYVRDVTERKRMEEHRARQLAEARLLYETTVVAAESCSVEETLQHCVDAVCRITGWPIGHVCMPAGGALASTRIWHLDDADGATAFREVTEGLRWKRGEGLPGRAWQSGGPVWVEDTARDPEFPRAKLLPEPAVPRAAFAFPVATSGGRLLAVFEFFTGDKTPRDDALLLLVQSVGNQIGRVVERQQAERQKDLLLAELAHRVKNTLGIVQAIARQTAARAPSLTAFVDVFDGRLRALAAAHEVLTASEWRQVPLKTLIEATVSAYIDDPARLRVEALPAVDVRPATTVTLSMVLHELASNAAKHGALSSPKGRVVLGGAMFTEGGLSSLEIRWEERGGPAATEPPSQGFGLLMIENAIQHQHGGGVELAWQDAGLCCRLRLPLSQTQHGLAV